MAQETFLKCWIKYAPQHAQTVDGVVILRKPYGSQRARQGEMVRLIRHIQARIDNGKIWQARIYDYPGNRLIFQWHNMKGVTAGSELYGLIQKLDSLAG